MILHLLDEAIDSNSDKLALRFSKAWQGEFLAALQEAIHPITHKIIDKPFWDQLRSKLEIIANIQHGANPDADRFSNYARLYDAVIGAPCLEGFMANYLRHFHKKHLNWAEAQVLSVGCGTGFIEDWMIREFQMDPKSLVGVDISAGMISVANQRINAYVLDFLKMEQSAQYDILFSGLNVFQYMNPAQFENAIRKSSELVSTGGFFVGDFIDPSHISWYPNVIFSKDENVISLRTPEIIETDGFKFQESEIFNISFLSDYFEVHFSGKHKRYLPGISVTRNYFENYFGGEAEVLDPVSMQKILVDEEETRSTRYLITIKKN